MYAIIRTGGKQYRVSEGDVLEVEKLNVQEGDEVVFDDVLTADKIFVFKYKAKSNYRKRQGHRQPFTRVEITSIEA